MNKEEHNDVPVSHVDTVADLALLGPITTTLPAITLSAQKDLPLGTEVYALGYPGAAEDFPQPTISRGLISRYRTWDTVGLTFVQTDASVAPGQSGGILVAKDGKVIGIVGYSLAQREYGVALTAEDAQKRVEAMLAGTLPDTARWVWTSSLKGRVIETVELRHGWSEAALVMHASVNTTVHLTFKLGVFRSPVKYTVYDPSGRIKADGEISGSEASDQFTIGVNGPHYLLLIPATRKARSISVAVESNVSLVRHPEFTQGPLVKVGETRYGVIDFPDDVDIYRLVLSEGETVNVHVSGLMVDPILAIDLLDKPLPEEALLGDDNSGGGVFGTDAELTFRAPRRGTYALIVTDLSGDVGGYVLTIRKPYKGAPTPVIIRPTPTPLPSSAGPMYIYRSKTAPYVQIRYPANWSSDIPDYIKRNLCDIPGATLCLAAPFPVAFLTVVEENLTDFGLGGMTAKEYVNLWKKAFIARGAKIVHEEWTKNKQGLDVYLVEASLLDGRVTIHKLMYANDNKGVAVTFTILKPDEILPNEVHRFVRDTLPQIVRYVFSTFTVEQ